MDVPFVPVILVTKATDMTAKVCSIYYFHKDHTAPYYPKILQNHRFQFLLGITVKNRRQSLCIFFFCGGGRGGLDKQGASYSFMKPFTYCHC